MIMPNEMTRISRPPSANQFDLREDVGGGQGKRAVGLNRLAQTMEPRWLFKLNDHCWVLGCFEASQR